MSKDIFRQIMTGRGLSLNLKSLNEAKSCLTPEPRGSNASTVKMKEVPTKEGNEEVPGNTVERARTRKEKHEMLSETRGRSPNNTTARTMGRTTPTEMLDAGCYTPS